MLIQRSVITREDKHYENTRPGSVKLSRALVTSANVVSLSCFRLPNNLLIPSQSDFNQWKKPYLLLVEYHQSFKYWFLESPAFEHFQEQCVKESQRSVFLDASPFLVCLNWIKYKCCFSDLETLRILFFLSLFMWNTNRWKNDEFLQFNFFKQ